MASPPDLSAERSFASPAGQEPGLDWPRLMRADTLREAVELVARWIGPAAVRLAVTSTDPAEPLRIVWNPGGAVEPSPTAVARLPGPPPWKLELQIAVVEAQAQQTVTLAALALEAWRHARGELERADRTLAARTGELDMLQAVGRRAAEAQTVADLFGSTVAVFHEAAELDLVLAAYLEQGAPHLQFHVARPFTQPYLAALERRARRFLGCDVELSVPASCVELESYDSARASDRLFREEDLILLPLLRRGQPVACLIVIPSAELRERQLRLLYGTSNQLALHMDRILTVREAEADRFRTIVDSMPQGVLLADDRLRLLQANRSARRMLETAGLPLGDALDETLDVLGAEAVLEHVRARRRDAAECDVMLAADRSWTITVSPLRVDGKQLSGWVIVLADVTDQRRLQQQLAQAEKLSSLGQMLSGVAHELNNPLASIVGYSQLLRLRGPQEKLAERLDVLARESERCRKIVQNLLSFARRREPERKPLSLNQVVQAVVTLLAYQMRVDNVTVDCRLDRELPALRGDAHQLEQMLVNLLSNARQAIGETGDAGTIYIRTRVADTDWVILEVEDTGPGIAPCARSRIFDPFFTTKGLGQGTGLGLSLVHGIVTDHAGRIEVLGGCGRGSLFRVKLPRGEPTSATAVDARPEALPPAPPSNILVVDDEEPLARLICDVLSGDGHSLHAVSDGQQALERVAESPFDLVISDVKMPGIGGERLHEELGKLRPELSRRMLLTTGDTLDRQPDEIAQRTGLDVLSKPFDLEELRRKVRARLTAD